MPRHIFIARHGETEWNRQGRWQGHTDIALNDAGRAQARTLAVALRGHGITAVTASDLSRARETGEIVAREIGAMFNGVDADLRERRYGVFEGLTRDECAERFPDLWSAHRADPRRPPPGAEAYEDVTLRMTAALHRVAGGAGGDAGASLVVSHGGAMRVFLLAVTGTMPPPLENGAAFRLTVASVGADGVVGFEAVERIV